MRIKLTPESKLDLKEAVLWYNKEQKGLGKRFFDTFQDALNRIKSNPNASATRYKNIRSKPIHKFPFCVHYLVDQENKIITVYGVWHNSRNPETWIDRIN